MENKIKGVFKSCENCLAYKVLNPCGITFHSTANRSRCSCSKWKSEGKPLTLDQILGLE